LVIGQIWPPGAKNRPKMALFENFTLSKNGTFLIIKITGHFHLFSVLAIVVGWFSYNSCKNFTSMPIF
jgi:hypothetical protein